MLNCKYCNKEWKNDNSLRNHERLCKLNPNRQLTPSEMGKGMVGRPAWNKGLTAKTDSRLAKAQETYKINAEKGLHNTNGHPHTEETKKHLSEVRKKYLKDHPDKVPYLLNHSSNISYPEQYFLDLIEAEDLDLKYHLQVSLYQLDFYNEEKMVDLEIDGDQHYISDKNIERDLNRDKYLTSLGWKVIRIKWSDYKKKTLQEKQLVIDEIKKLLI